MSGETRARRRIRLAVESRDYRLSSLKWTHWHPGGEKEGICGGWYGTTDRPYLTNQWPGDDIMGLSVEETLAWIDEFVPTPEPCECGLTHYPLTPLLDDPLTGRHLPTCRWYIRYRLPWWHER